MTDHKVGSKSKRVLLTDDGNAQRFIAQHGEKLRYCPQWGKWLIWDGQRWAVDERNEVMSLAKKTARWLYAKAAGRWDDKESERLGRHALKSQYVSRLKAMIELAQSEPGVAVLAKEWDQNEWLLNVENGTLDLQRQELRPFRREDLITEMAPVTYDPKAACAKWLAFLERITGGNPDLVAFLQRVVGYSLTGSTREQCFFTLYGTGANGKSTFLGILGDLLGEYAKTARPETWLAKDGNGIPHDIARLQGARLIVSQETERGKRLAESLVKQITGGDVITARHLYHEEFQFMFTGKLFVATNHEPEIRGTDEGIWRRTRLIPFNVCIPEAERDKDLPAKLRAELPGILAWAVLGCKAWLDGGLGVPPAVRDATDEYRREMNPVAAFACARLVHDPASSVMAKEMFEEYTDYCKQHGKLNVGTNEFPRMLAELGYTKKETAKGNCWVGVRVQEEGCMVQAAA